MKIIESFPNYSISETGEIFNILRKRRLKTQLDHAGYEKVALHHQGKVKVFLVHRLVAEAYIPNPDNLPQINHKDMVKSNNCVSNLEWCTSKYNVNYGGPHSPISKMRKARARPVVQICNGEIVGRYKSTTEAEIITGIHQTNISKCCLHRKWYKSAGGYQWEYDIK